MRRPQRPHNQKSTNRPATGGPIRTCVACARAFAVSKSQARAHAAFDAQSTQGSLQVLRLCARRSSQTSEALPEASQVLLDWDGRAMGRGAWLCARAECIEKAWQRKAIERALKGARLSEELKQRLLLECAR